MREFVQMMREVKQIESTLDENFEKIWKQGANVFPGMTDLVWSTERILDQFDCTTKERVSYTVSLFQQDAWDWWETVPRS